MTYRAFAIVGSLLLGIHWAGAQPRSPPSKKPSAPTKTAPARSKAAKNARPPTPVATLPCRFTNNKLTVSSNQSLVAVLQHPPKTRVTLSIDAKGGFHRELVWDPAVGDGLRHDVLLRPLPADDEYILLAYAEEDRVQTSQIVVMRSTQFTACLHDEEDDPSLKAWCQYFSVKDHSSALLTSKQQTVAVTPATRPADNTRTTDDMAKGIGPIVDTKADAYTPRIKLVCETQQVELADVHLAQKQVFAASVARGFLDQSAPKVVTDTLAILAEIAVERAKAGAMDIVKTKFVEPVCEKLNLGLLRLGSASDLAFPRTCAMLQDVRLEDLFASGRNLVNAARDDVRLTLVPALVTKANIPSAARDVARMALDVGNKMLDGATDEVAALDLLVTQLERTFLRGAVATLPGVREEFLHLVSTLSQPAREAFVNSALDNILPEDPGALVSEFVVLGASDVKKANDLEVRKAEACFRLKDTKQVFVPADRRACIEALQKMLLAKSDWLAIVRGLISTDELIGLASAARQQANLSSFEDWLEAYGTTEATLKPLVETLEAAAKNVKQLDGIVPDALRRSCAVRLTVAIVKWCSSRDNCAASDIATAFDDPQTLFKATSKMTRDRLCWVSDTFQKPASVTPYIELATRAMAFLTPPAKTEQSARIRSMLRWMFDLARTLDPNVSSSITKLEEILQLFEEKDYVRALSQTMAMAIESGCGKERCATPPELRKAMTLFGAVASYLQVYDDTKSADPAEAKAARKKAIETLIDSATDRRGREGQWIFSLGLSAGLTGGVHSIPSADSRAFSSTFDAYEHRFASMWRIPLGFSLQRIPWNYLGYHFAITFADLGNFLRQDDDDEIKWNDFLQLGVQAGLTFGNKKHAVIIALDANWSPGTYARRVVIGSDTRNRFEVVDGAFGAGITLAYYLPIFDLN